MSSLLMPCRRLPTVGGVALDVAAKLTTPRRSPLCRAWDLINEPVCRGCAPGTIASWVREMAAHVKSLDSAHLLTVGEEGFYSATK